MRGGVTENSPQPALSVLGKLGKGGNYMRGIQLFIKVSRLEVAEMCPKGIRFHLLRVVLLRNAFK